MTVRRRLTIAVAAVVAAAVFGMAVGTWASRERARTVSVLTVTLATERDIAHLEQCLQDLHRQVTLLAQTFEGNAATGLDADVREGLTSQLETCRRHAGDLAGGAAAPLASEAGLLLDDWSFVAGNLGVQHVAALARQATAADPRSRSVLYELLPSARDAQAARVVEAQADFGRVSSRTDVALSVALAASLLIVSVAALTLLRRTSSALGTVAEGVERIGQGDFEHRVTVGGSDEFADVAREVNAMAARLQSTTAELEERALTLQRTVEQLRAAQATLVEQEKMAALGSLVAGVAHEVNTPLGVAVTTGSLVHGQFEELRAHAEAGTATRGLVRRIASESEEALRLMLDNLQRAARLIQSFKQVAVDRGQVATRSTLMGEWARAVVQSLSPLARKHGVNVVVSVDGDRRTRLAAGELEQVLTNLLVNAMVHAYGEPSEGDPQPAVGSPAREVKVDVTCLPDALVIEVSDRGVGMPPEVASRVFEPFFTTRRGQGGTGLGMHIVHQVVNGRFNGTVSLTTAPGEGTRWTLRLPAATEALRYEGSVALVPAGVSPGVDAG